MNDLLVVAIEEHLEELLAGLGVIRQRAVGEAESRVAMRADVVDDATAIQGPEPEMAHEHRHHGSDRERSVVRKRFNPTNVELPPSHQRGFRAFEIGVAAANGHDRLIEIV